MRVIENIKFMPTVDVNTGAITSYYSKLEVEVSGQVFSANRRMPSEEYESTYPALRDFIHDALRTDIMTQIRKKLFEGVV
jgi:hypothetical protein